jgi:hypothetical protein
LQARINQDFLQRIVPLQDFRINLDFNQDFMHSRTESIEIAVLVPLSISISTSIRKIDIVEQGLSISIRKIDSRTVPLRQYSCATLSWGASERLFSSAADVFTDDRNQLKIEKGDMLLFITHNLPNVDFNY